MTWVGRFPISMNDTATAGAETTRSEFSFCSRSVMSPRYAAAQDHSCRHGRLLCVGRTTRRCQASGPSGRCRRRRQTEKLARDVVARILALVDESAKPIQIYVNSPGGHVESGD